MDKTSLLTKEKRKRLMTNLTDDRETNKGLAKVSVQCSVDTFLVNRAFVLRINISGKIPVNIKSANRYE